MVDLAGGEKSLCVAKLRREGAVSRLTFFLGFSPASSDFNQPSPLHMPFAVALRHSDIYNYLLQLHNRSSLSFCCILDSERRCLLPVRGQVTLFARPGWD